MMNCVMDGVLLADDLRQPQVSNNAINPFHSSHSDAQTTARPLRKPTKKQPVRDG
jgi:hypothetical protein